MKSLVFIAAVTCLALCPPVSPPVLATTRYVDGSVSASGDGMSWNTAFKTIQEGIGAAADGHTVVVAEGSYVENVHFDGKNITLTSTDAPNPDVVGNTIIDGAQIGPAVTFQGTEDETCRLRGFTIRNGRADYGAGIIGSKGGFFTRAIIERNQIRDNFAFFHGGALAYCDGAIVQNTIVASNATDSGGALYACNGLIAWNAIGGNSARRGGGLAKCQATVRGNIVSDNRASAEGGGRYSSDICLDLKIVLEYGQP